MKSADADIVVVGAGPAELSCAKHFLKNSAPLAFPEADQRIGGRLLWKHSPFFQSPDMTTLLVTVFTYYFALKDCLLKNG